MSTTNSSTSNNKNLTIGAIVVLALLSIFLLFRNYSLNKSNSGLEEQFSETTKLKEELNNQYNDALAELQELHGSNEELNALIEQQKDDLTAQKDKIESLLGVKGNLNKARKELKSLKAKMDSYREEINQLRAQNEELVATNTNLTDQNSSLQTNLESERINSAELSSERAMLISDKERLSEERSRLSKKVNIASVIKVENIEAGGYKIRSTGKAVKKKFAKNVSELHVCFSLTENNITEAGVENFMIRILSPRGETIAVDDLGSGVFMSQATNEDIRFTKIAEVDYENKAENTCIKWTPGKAFDKGTYKVEIYNKGYLAGNTTFVLK